MRWGREVDEVWEEVDEVGEGRCFKGWGEEGKDGCHVNTSSFPDMGL